MFRYVFWALVLTILGGSLTAQTSDKKSDQKADAPKSDGKELLKVEGELTKDDPFDKEFKESHRKEHNVQLKEGELVRIDLKSKAFDCYLRVEDDQGKVLAANDDSGDPGDLNSRLRFKAPKAGTYKLIVTTFGGPSPLPGKTGAYVLTVKEPTRMDEFHDRALKVGQLNQDEVKILVGDLKKYFAEKKKDLGKEESSLAMLVGGRLEQKDRDLAAKVYTDLGTLLAKSSDKGVEKTAARMIGAGRRLKLPGHEIEVKGTTLEGKALDWKTYRGKVVLVDFWATWCGPCRAEIPHMKELYEAYKDRGFEIVGVSIDSKRADLEKFMEKEKLPWVCLHEKDAKDGQPLAEHYGVMFIPLPILVDRDGKVISMQARGPELTRLLEKHIGPNNKKENKEKEKEKEKDK